MLLMPMLLGALLLAEPEATDTPRRDELDIEARIGVAADAVTIQLQLTSRAQRPLRFTLPAGLSFRPIGRDAPVVFALEPAEIDLAAGGTQKLSIPAVPLAASDRLAGPAMADVPDALGPAIKLVATIHDLAQAGTLRSPPGTVARCALQLPPVGSGDQQQLRSQVTPDVWQEIEMSLVTAFPPVAEEPPKETTAAGPAPASNLEGWYAHAQGGYRFHIPDGWTLVPGQRNTVADKEYDTLRSPDQRYTLVCSRNVWPAPDAHEALEAYRQKQLPDIPDYRELHQASFLLGNAPAVRLGYVVPGKEIAVWRMSVVFNERRYVLYAIAPAAEFGGELPLTLRHILETFVFISEH